MKKLIWAQRGLIFTLGKFHLDLHPKGLFLPKHTRPGCILMWANPIPEFSLGPVTEFSKLAPAAGLEQPDAVSCRD